MTRTSTDTTLTWDDIGFICESMAFASGPLGIATRGVTEEFSLGPRGAWILVLISSGTVYPLDITNVFRIGRSLISMELARLSEAGLTTSVKSDTDRRRTELALTPLGAVACRRVRDQLSELVHSQLTNYTKEEMLTCARMLRDFRNATGARSSPMPSKVK